MRFGDLCGGFELLFCNFAGLRAPSRGYFRGLVLLRWFRSASLQFCRFMIALQGLFFCGLVFLAVVSNRFFDILRFFGGAFQWGILLRFGAICGGFEVILRNFVDS